MSITYSADVRNTKIWTFIRILIKWNGSLFQWIWVEAIVFVGLYEFIAIMFHYIITTDRFPLGNLIIKSIIEQFQLAYNMLTVAFVLGFYVTLIVVRWFEQQKYIPWTDDIAFLVSAYIRDNSEHAVEIRRTIMRYINAGYLIAARQLFKDFKKQFPDEKQIIKSGLLNETEIAKLNKIETGICKYFIPITWALKLICKAKDENLIMNDRAFDILVERVATYRGEIESLFRIDFINPPLCYAQIAESLINPFGSTDYNFDVIYSLQRNLQMAFLIVDHLHDVTPSLKEENLLPCIMPQVNPIFNLMNSDNEIEILDEDVSD